MIDLNKDVKIDLDELGLLKLGAADANLMALMLHMLVGETTLTWNICSFIFGESHRTEQGSRYWALGGSSSI
jgi:hypothetical protein